MTPARPPAIDLVVDTSAILALALEEPTAHAVQAVLESAGGPVISAAIVVELHIVAAARFGPAGADAANTILDAANVVTMPVDAIQADLATTAGIGSAEATTPLGSTTETVSRTRSPAISTCRCCASGRTSPEPTSTSSTSRCRPELNRP